MTTDHTNPELDANTTDADRSAEQRAAALESTVARLRSELDQARAAADDSEHQRRLDLELVQAGAVDLDTARLLARRAAADREDAGASEIVSTLKRDKPFLFNAAPAAPAPGAAMSPRADDDEGELNHLARRASTGDRAALMDYLRARRA